jgi:hypothetical protein
MDDNQPDSSKNNDDLFPIILMMTENLAEVYEPVDVPGPGVELLSTLDIMEEMSNIADVEKMDVVKALLQSGFKTYYSDAGFCWLLQKK